MMRRALAAMLCLSGLSGAARAMSPGDAFNAGQSFGTTELGTVRGTIDEAKAKDAGKGIPNYSDTDPASAHYAGGYGSLTGPASTEANDCTSTPGASDPTLSVHGKCEATRMILKDPGKKSAMFPLDKKTDPIVVKRNDVAADAETYLGSLIAKGDYGACVKKTVSDPDVYETEYCHQFLTRNDEICHETLSVTVTVIESCVPGTWYGGYKIAQEGTMSYWVVADAYCDMSRADGKIGLRFTPQGLHGGVAGATLDVPIAPFTVSDTVTMSKGAGINHEFYVDLVYKGDTVRIFIGYEPGYTQGCDAYGFCTYTFRSIDWRWGHQIVNSAGAYELPRTQYIETDTWDDQCAGWKAKVAK